MLTTIKSVKLIGIDAVPVSVECDLTPGIGIHLVGLADAAVKESLLRTVTALQSLGYRIPGKKIVINLAPADLRKDGTGYDLPIALGLLSASQQEDFKNTEDILVYGELALDGKVRDIPGAVNIIDYAEKNGNPAVILPAGCARETLPFINRTKVYAVDSLADAVKVLTEKDSEGLLVQNRIYPETPERAYTDFKDIPGAFGAKRALEIAAAGGLGRAHHHAVASAVARRLAEQLRMLAKQRIVHRHDLRLDHEQPRLYPVLGALFYGAV